VEDWDLTKFWFSANIERLKSLPRFYQFFKFPLSKKRFILKPKSSGLIFFSKINIKKKIQTRI